MHIKKHKSSKPKDLQASLNLFIDHFFLSTYNENEIQEICSQVNNREGLPPDLSLLRSDLILTFFMNLTSSVAKCVESVTTSFADFV